MEAQFVSPAPPKAPQQFNNRTDSSSGESAFAPELSKALNDTTKKGDGSAASSHRENNENQAVEAKNQRLKEKKEEIGQTDASQAQAAPPAANEPQQPPSAISDGKTQGPSEKALANAAEKITNPVAREKSALFKFFTSDGENQQSKLQPVEKQSIVSQLSQTGAKPQTENQAPATHRIAAHLSQNNALSGIKTENTQEMALNSVIQKVEPGTFQNSNNTVPVFNKQDTLSWTQQVTPADTATGPRGAYPVLLNEHLTAAQNSPATLSTESIMARLSQIAGESGQPPLRGNQPLRDNAPVSIRHDISGQFLQAKTDMTQSAKDGQTGQQFLESEGNLSKQQPLASSMTKSVDLQPDSSFSHALNHAADKPTPSTADALRPATVPFTTQQMTENDILNQVTQRLRFSNIAQDTKLVMRLHPAELGNLKVDIHLKDGTVNANIVAQTQQVHEILEKHMPRLRELMQQNGLHVGEIAIRLDSDLPTEQNLFEEQLAQQNDMESGDRNTSNSRPFVLNQDIEEELEENQSDTSQSVNLKA